MIEMGWRAAQERESRLDWYVRHDSQRGITRSNGKSSRSDGLRTAYHLIQIRGLQDHLLCIDAELD